MLGIMKVKEFYATHTGIRNLLQTQNLFTGSCILDQFSIAAAFA
jgi:hypothetical protein